MHEVIRWAMETEDTARRFYEKAALRFPGDPELSSLLAQLARDEQSHYDMIRKLYRRSGGEEMRFPGLVAVDRAAMCRVEGELAACATALDNGDLSPDGIIEALVDIEFSECNEIFLYVINMLRADREDFVTAGAHIQMHRGVIKRFLAKRPGFRGLLDHIGRLPSLGRLRILVVSDNGGVAEALESVLSLEGSVVTAAGADDASRKIQTMPFTAVVADTDGSDCDLAAIHALATGINPSLVGRFIFLSPSGGIALQDIGASDRETILVKPVTIGAIKDALFNIKNRKDAGANSAEGDEVDGDETKFREAQ